jgi:hypothetical protein
MQIKGHRISLFSALLRPIVLKRVLSQVRYEHFLNLNVSIRLLTSDNLTDEKIQFEDELFKYSVDQFGILYGDDIFVYHLHSLSHLANECRVHGPLQSFSPFKSFLCT